MKQSKVHSCIIQEMVAMGKMEPRKPKCRCRKFVEYKEADEMVKRGEALWIVLSRERGVQEKACKICLGQEPSPNCETCKGSGRMEVPVVWDTYNSDIVLVNHRTKSNKVSTPRVPTIESEHIERAYVEGNPEAAERIEEYGRLIQWQFYGRGATIGVKITGAASKDQRVIHLGVAEPENDRRSFPPGTITFKDGSKNKSWYWITEGRDVEYGRAL